MTTSSGKHLEDINRALIVSLMYILITRARGSDDLSHGFDCDCNRMQRELTNNKTNEGKYQLRNMLGDIFGYIENQEKETFGLGYKLTLTRNTDNSVLNKENATVTGKVKINSIELYIPHYTPSIS